MSVDRDFPLTVSSETPLPDKPAASLAVDESRQAALEPGTAATGGRPQAEEVGAALRQEVAERQRTEEALRRSEEMFRLAVKATNDAIWDIDLTTGTVHWNDTYTALYGRPPETSSSWQWWIDHIHPEDRERAVAGLRSAIDSNASNWSGEYRFQRVDGSWADVYDRCYIARDPSGNAWRVIGAMRDLTDRRRAEGRLRETSRRFQTILDHAPVAIYVKDREGRFVLGNRRLERFTGRSLDVTIGTTDYDWSPAEDADRWRENDLKVLESGRVWEFEETGTDVDGHPYVNLSIKFPLTDDSGTPVAVCGISTDISARKAAEEALREADRRKDEFIAVLSHELRNPLAPIRYALPLLQRERLGDAAARAVDVINRQVDHLTQLVDDLLDVSRISGGKVELRRRHVTLDSILMAAIEAASPAIVAGGHALTTAIEEEPIWLHADPARIAQVVTNLLDNSAKYTPRGGEIRLQAGREDDHAFIRVSDTGIGIPAEAFPALFQMFRQVSRPDKSQGGLGIGLALVKRLVELHAGSVEAASAGVGRGAEFVVRLPVVTPEEATTAEVPTPGGTRARGRRLKVLVVDDNADLVEMLAMLVESGGHEVRTALDGRSAISAAVSYRPDVVLLDLGLPTIGGVEVARELRRHAGTARVRIVALTGWGQARDRRQTSEAGFDHHLTKPADPRTLERLLARFADELADT